MEKIKKENENGEGGTETIENRVEEKRKWEKRWSEEQQ